MSKSSIAIFHLIKNPFHIAGLALFAFLGLLWGCANPILPEGGPVDRIPPKLDTLRSTPNFQTHFKKQTIVLAFDEWVELKDVFNQVVISPPLVNRPEIVRRKKTVQVIFDEKEELRDSATYVVNFGDAIRDLTESNPARIVFVFSTGDFIDSLSVEGSIADAWTGEPVENVLFMLYENLADSVVRKDRPFYFARTDKAGRFRVDNVKAGTFKAFALLDQNLNYRFDSDAEQIGFPDSMLLLRNRLPAAEENAMPSDSLSSDSLGIPAGLLPPLRPPAPKINLRIFLEEKPLFLRSKDASRYGMVKLAFNREPYDAGVSFDSIGQSVFLENDRDSIRIWYRSELDTSWNIYVQRDTFVDTVLVKSGLRTNFLKTTQLTAKAQAPGPPLRLPPGRPLSISFSHPLTGFNPEAILLLEDTLKTAVQAQMRIDSLNPRNLLIDFPWKGAVEYEAHLLPGGATDIFGLTSADSTVYKFVGADKKDFGALALRVRNLSPDTAYVIRLLEKENPLYTFQTVAADSFQTTLKNIAPITYTVEIIEDLDGNGRWTTGNYKLHRQPERVYRKVLEQLRANWEMEAEIDVGLLRAADSATGANRKPLNPSGGIEPGGR